VRLGDLYQRIDPPPSASAVNRVEFSVAGAGALRGSLTVSAAYKPSADHPATRVDISFNEAKLEPAALEALFKANYVLLLSIFNPEGWLDVTYLDGELRVGRDDKGHVFVLEKKESGDSGDGGDS
jgi:hypothetical protein